MSKKASEMASSKTTLAATSPATIWQNKHDALEFSVSWRRGLAIELFYAREFARGKAGIARRAYTRSSAEYRVYPMVRHAVSPDNVGTPCRVPTFLAFPR